jgi:Alginate export
VNWARCALSCAVLVTGLASPLFAQDVERTTVRYDENRSSCNDDSNARVKCVSIDSDREIYTTFGLDLRARYEGLQNNNFLESADDGYLWLRAMPRVDLHAGPFRFFAQPIAGYAVGVEPAAGAIDQTGLDLLQGFAEVQIGMGRVSALTVRGGRALVALGSERLVGTRYGPNSPQSFDGFRASFRRPHMMIDLLHVRPVLTGVEDFDDRTSKTKRLKAVYGTIGDPSAIGLDIYWLNYRDQEALYGGVRAIETRSTYGLRYYGSKGAVGWNWEAMLQGGRFDNKRISAWSVATETSIALSDLPLRPRIRMRANIASGDRNPDDRKLGTFNAMFPKGKYFGELSPLGPRNIYNVQPDISFDLNTALNLSLAFGMFWRASIDDGIYDLPGNEIRSARDGRARSIGKQSEIAMEWQVQPSMSYAASFSLFRPGRYLRQAGAKSSIALIGLEASYKF